MAIWKEDMSPGACSGCGEPTRPTCWGKEVGQAASERWLGNRRAAGHPIQIVLNTLRRIPDGPFVKKNIILLTQDNKKCNYLPSMRDEDLFFKYRYSYRSSMCSFLYQWRNVQTCREILWVCLSQSDDHYREGKSQKIKKKLRRMAVLQLTLYIRI